MLQTKKRKEISWLLHEDKSTYEESRDKRPSKKEKLTEKDKVFAAKIAVHLDHELFELLTYKLDELKQRGKLHELLKYNHYHLFAWALEHRNLYLVNYLLQNLSAPHCFIMLQDKDWAAIKAFIKISKNLEWNTDFDHVIVPILRSILKIQPNWQIIEIIENSLSDQSTPANIDTIKKLKSRLSLEIKASSDCVEKVSVIARYQGVLFNTLNNSLVPKKLEEEKGELIQKSDFQVALSMFEKK